MSPARHATSLLLGLALATASLKLAACSDATPDASPDADAGAHHDVDASDATKAIADPNIIDPNPGSGHSEIIDPVPGSGHSEASP